MMPVTGCSSSAGACTAPVRLLAVGERHPRLDVGDVPDALGRHRGVTRMPTRIASAAPQSTHVQQRGVGAVGADQRERERLRSSGCLPGARLRDPGAGLTAPRGPTSTIRRRRDSALGRRVVLGRRHQHAPSAVRTPTIRPSRSPVKKRPMTGPTERV